MAVEFWAAGCWEAKEKSGPEQSSEIMGKKKGRERVRCECGGRLGPGGAGRERRGLPAQSGGERFGEVQGEEAVGLYSSRPLGAMLQAQVSQVT